MSGIPSAVSRRCRSAPPLLTGLISHYIPFHSRPNSYRISDGVQIYRSWSYQWNYKVVELARLSSQTLHMNVQHEDTRSHMITQKECATEWRSASSFQECKCLKNVFSEEASVNVSWTRISKPTTSFPPIDGLQENNWRLSNPFVRPLTDNKCDFPIASLSSMYSYCYS